MDGYGTMLIVSDKAAIQAKQECPVTIEIPERLLTPGEVAAMFRVDPKTVTRWASAGGSVPSVLLVGTVGFGSQK